MTQTEFDAHLERVRSGLQTANNADLQKKYGNLSDAVTIKIGRKFVNLDIGRSGAFMVEKATGELYNIKGYGQPDYNKKKKADIGNIATVDPAWLLTKRWNYLR